MTDGHTFVIPTFNRAALVQRLVRYYRRRAPSSDLLVLDSSQPDVVQDNAKALSSWGGSVRHIAFPGNVLPLAKLVRGLELVESPYVSFCADDDLIFPEALHEAQTFLEAHADYATAHGLYLNFRPDGRDVHLLSEYAGPANELASPGARVFRLLQKYESLFYGTFRTAQLREICAAMQGMPAVVFQELFQSVATVLCGKVKRFAAFYAARQSGPPAEPKRERWQTYYWFADNPGEMLEHYAAYCEALWKFYEAHGAAPRLERAAFFRTLHLAHAVYFSAGCPPEYFHSALQSYWPQDSYLDVREVDLLAQLAPARGGGHAAARLWQRLARRVRNASLSFGLSGLAREAAQAGGTAWQCRLPLKLHWLTHNTGFRASWLELCRYLDT